MKHDENTSVAPITGRGITMSRSWIVGKNAMTMNSAPVASPTTREVTPVATDAPTEPDVVPSATVPRRSRHDRAEPVGGEAVADHPHVRALPAGIVDLLRGGQVADSAQRGSHRGDRERQRSG